MSKRIRKFFGRPKRSDHPTSHSGGQSTLEPRSGQGIPGQRSHDQPTQDPRRIGQPTPDQHFINQRITDLHTSGRNTPDTFSSSQPTVAPHLGDRPITESSYTHQPTPNQQSVTGPYSGQPIFEATSSGQRGPTQQPSPYPSFIGQVTGLQPGQPILEEASRGHPAPHSSGQLINNGIYTIANVYYKRFVYLEDPNGGTPLVGHFEQDNNSARWRLTYRENEEYSMENVEHDRYANSGNRAVMKAHVEGSIQVQLWRIQRVPTGEYTIATIDTRNLWMLPDGTQGTPVELFDRHTDSRCWWTFTQSVDPVNESPTIQAVLSEPEPPLARQEPTRREEEDRRRFMKWLSDIDYKQDHEANSRNILENSGNWMLESEEFRSWKEGGGLLWLRGIPGAGKTKLTSTIIDHLTKTNENHTVAYFYCIRDTKQPKKEDPEEILRAILKQLVILSPSRLPDPVKAKYDEKKKGSDHGSLRSLTFEECSRFIVELATIRPATIVIDALDECRETKVHSSQGSYTDRRDLVDRLEEMIDTKSGNVKVFLSSRDDDDIGRRLKMYPTIALDASRNGADIRSFIEAAVDDLMRKKSHWEDDKTLKEAIIGAVNDRADGMFRFAALQIDYLGGLNTRDSVRKRLRNLPRTLRDIYNEIYGRILAMEEDESSIAKIALSWLLCARRQLRSDELLAAVSPNPGEWVNLGELLNLCRHLVVLNEVSDSFELAHLTVREYLETLEEYKDGQPQALVAERCIKLFEPEVPRGILDQYASLYWVDHYNNRPQTEEDAVADMVKKLFRNKGINPTFETWAKLARDSARPLPWNDNLARRLEEAKYKPLSVICVFGFTKLLDQWMDTIPGYSFLRDSDDMVVHLAIKWGNEGVVRLLLRGDNRPAIDKYGWTSAFWAAIFVRLPVLEVLKELHVSVDAEDKMGWTALDWMVILGRLEGLKILLRLEAGANMTNEDKWTPLHWAALLDREAETKELVAYHRADAEDSDGFTPLQWAKYLGHEATTQHLRTSEAGGSFGSSLRASFAVKTVRMDRDYLHLTQYS